MSDDICPGCGSRFSTPSESHLELCTKCSERLGVTVMPRSRRPATPCRGCAGMRFIRAVPRELAPGGATGSAAPMVVTYGAAVDFAYVPQHSDPRRGYGMLEM